MRVSFSRPRSIWSHHRWTTPGCIPTCGLTHCVEVSPWSSRTRRLKTSRRPFIVLSDRASPESFASSVWSMKRIAWATMLRQSGRTSVCCWSACSLVSRLFQFSEPIMWLFKVTKKNWMTNVCTLPCSSKIPIDTASLWPTDKCYRLWNSFRKNSIKISNIRWTRQGEESGMTMTGVRFQINLPSKIFEKNILDPLWLYGACLLALIVLLVVILMLMSILMKKT